MDEIKAIRLSWRDMHARRKNPSHPAYKNYGGRGIKVEKRWDSFAFFLEDMYPTWFPFSTLDRKDNDGPYSKDNCRWIEKRFQTIVGRLRTRSDNSSGIPGVEFCRGGWRVVIKLEGRTGPKKTIYAGQDLFEAACVRKSWENRKKEYWRQQGAPD